MKKHSIALLILLAFCSGLAFVACGDDDDDDDDDSGDDNPFGELTWQEPPSNEDMTWQEAVEFCKKLNFDGYDDWRLPTISELRSLIRGCDATGYGGTCGVTEGCTGSDCWTVSCRGCEAYEGEGPGDSGAYWPSGISGDIGYYWSSTLNADQKDEAWGVDFSFGGVFKEGFDSTHEIDGVRCVR